MGRPSDFRADYLLDCFLFQRGHYRFELTPSPEVAFFSVYGYIENRYDGATRVIYAGEAGDHFAQGGKLAPAINDPGFFHFRRETIVQSRQRTTLQATGILAGTIPARECVQVHLGAGVGNIVLATSLLVGLHKLGFSTDVVLAADYAETETLLRGWSAIREIFRITEAFPSAECYSWVIPAIPPFYWVRYATSFASARNLVSRPPDALFYQDEQEYYWAFARSLGCKLERRPHCTLPFSPILTPGSGQQTLVLAPGCKTGEMAAKRWPHYSELAERFEHVAVVGTADDLRRYDAKPLRFGPHVKMLVDRLTMRETAEFIAAAGAFVGNDSGLSHIGWAVGTPTVMLFGPTPDRTLGRFPPNVRVLRRGSPCEPCWFGSRFQACARRIDCLREIPVDAVVTLLRELGFVAQ